MNVIPMLEEAGRYVEGLPIPVRLLVVSYGVHITAYSVPAGRKAERVVSWQEIACARFNVVVEAIKATQEGLSNR